MNILAVDYGSKNIGLAWSDTTFGAVLPFGLVEGKTVAEKAKKLAKVINEEKIERVVIGYPLSLKGGENANTERIKKFGFELAKLIKADIVYHDERFSSYGADAMGEGVSRDERSAMIILEGYIEKMKRSKK